MDVEARAGREPSPDASVFVRRVVIDDEMNVQPLGDRRFDVAQELEKLLVAMSLLALREHATRSHVERRE